MITKKDLENFFSTKEQQIKTEMKKFITFTFPGNYNKSDEAKIELFRNFIKKWVRLEKFTYIWIAEHSEKNAIHFHLMISININYALLKCFWEKTLGVLNLNISSCYVADIWDAVGLIKYLLKTNVKTFGMSTNYYKTFREQIKSSKSENVVPMNEIENYPTFLKKDNYFLNFIRFDSKCANAINKWYKRYHFDIAKLLIRIYKKIKKNKAIWKDKQSLNLRLHITKYKVVGSKKRILKKYIIRTVFNK